MIEAKIVMADGDIVEMVFESWPALAAWMEANMGKYSSVDAKPAGGKG